MIVGYIGQRNSGKTLSMTIEAYRKYREGYTIYSNYHLNFPYKPYDIDDLMEFAEKGKYFGNTIFLIDEVHIYFDSRASAKLRNRIFSYFLNQSSKNDLDIYYTTQYSRQVDIRLRLNTEKVVKCNAKCIIFPTQKSRPILKLNYRPKPNDYKIITYIRQESILFNDTGFDRISVIMYKGNPFFKLYNTREVIKLQKTKQEKELEGKN